MILFNKFNEFKEEKMIKKLSYIFPILAIISAICFWGNKSSIYTGFFEGMSLTQLIILFILFIFSIFLQILLLYLTYKSNNIKLKTISIPIIITIISMILTFNIFFNINDILNVNQLKNICTENITKYEFQLRQESYSQNMQLEYDMFLIEEEMYKIYYDISKAGSLIFEFNKNSKDLIGVTLFIPESNEILYKSPLSLQSALLITLDETVFNKEYSDNLTLQLLTKVTEQGDISNNTITIEKNNYIINLTYLDSLGWEFEILQK